MRDNLNKSIQTLLARPGLQDLRFRRLGVDVYVEARSVFPGVVPRGVIVSDGGERTLVDAVDCLAAQAWDGGEPPDQLAEADARAAVPVSDEQAARNRQERDGYWSDDGDDGGIELHDNAELARGHALKHIEKWREQSEGWWPDEVRDVRWGTVVEVAKSIQCKLDDPDVTVTDFVLVAPGASWKKRGEGES